MNEIVNITEMVIEVPVPTGIQVFVNVTEPWAPVYTAFDQEPATSSPPQAEIKLRCRRLPGEDAKPDILEALQAIESGVAQLRQRYLDSLTPATVERGGGDDSGTSGDSGASGASGSSGSSGDGEADA